MPVCLPMQSAHTVCGNRYTERAARQLQGGRHALPQSLCCGGELLPQPRRLNGYRERVCSACLRPEPIQEEDLLMKTTAWSCLLAAVGAIVAGFWTISHFRRRAGGQRGIEKTNERNVSPRQLQGRLRRLSQTGLRSREQFPPGGRRPQHGRPVSSKTSTAPTKSTPFWKTWSRSTTKIGGCCGTPHRTP